ncbi:hypothetical protein DWU98_04535 [Dyella monticola]|uniref:Integrase catalytic domain-containing protein n=1 Tax=Dyella monticola TaxID=1927958 RepID=A0A370X5X9_9GAMM|nr:hypothetical protein [Dyella monticola]RDS83605.1 hypothetical protein DWU98_04535 [Dyella monticola]
MRDCPLSIVGVDVRNFVRPASSDIVVHHQAIYKARCAALIDVAGGRAITAAAKHHGVDPRTVGRDCEIAMELALDGLRVGFRACIPFRHRRPKLAPAEALIEAPITKGPYAFSQLLMRCVKLKKLVDDYKGALPGGNRKVRTFDRLFGQFKATVRAELSDKDYPFTVKDEGRRALLTYIKRVRLARLEAGAADVEDSQPNVVRFSQLFHLAPLDRIEFDAHKVDVDWHLNLEAPNGKFAKRHIECVTLLAAICAVSRYLLGYVLVLGSYNRLDVLRLFHRVLSPWHPRQLIVPDMQYPVGAQLGLPVNEHGEGPRGVAIAGDNALAHHADVCVENLVAHYRGILNFGPAHVPEVRPYVEALFRLLEQGALRQIAGGFQPETRTHGKTRTSFLSADDHPFHYEGLADLMDVIAAGYNVTPHSGLGGRTPASVLNTHLASGWSWYSSDALADASRLTTMRFFPRIRGDGSTGRLPFVQYYDAHYRSQKLMGRRDLVGQRFPAEANLEDLRHVVLLNPEDGAPWSRLTALPPWDRTPHDLHLRQQIIRARNRGLLELVGSRDAIEAYHAFTREQAAQGKASPDLYARVDAQFKPSSLATNEASTRPVVLPRRGPTSFAHRKD